MKKLRTFQTAAKTMQIKLRDKIVNLREERSLMMRLLVLAKTWTDVKLDKMIMKHEFSVTLRSLNLSLHRMGVPGSASTKVRF